MITDLGDLGDLSDLGDLILLCAGQED